MKERLPQRVIARSLKVGRQTVSDYLQGAEEELEGLLFPLNQSPFGYKKRQPLWQEVHTELKKTKGTTLNLLWKEKYYEEDPQTAYSQFCLLYRRRRKEIPLELRKDYRA